MVIRWSTEWTREGGRPSGENLNVSPCALRFLFVFQLRKADREGGRKAYEIGPDANRSGAQEAR